jgi:hypothetical protein
MMRKQFFTSAMRAAAVTGVLLPIASGSAAGQGPKPRQVAGCTYLAAEFHRCALAKAKTFNPPRTPTGKPDFQGLWETPGGAYNFEGAGGPEASSVVEPADGKIPYLPWARPHSQENVARYIDPYTVCLPAGVPRQLALFRTHQITQFPGFLTIVNEAGGHVYRVVYTDGRPHLGSNFKLWMGDSRGHWEGDTLVIETTNFNGRSWLDQSGHFASDALRVIERLTMVDLDAIHYAATIEDPKVFARPWTVVFALERNKEKGFEQMEEACHESDHDGDHFLRIGFKPYLGPRFPK